MGSKGSKEEHKSAPQKPNTSSPRADAGSRPTQQTSNTRNASPSAPHTTAPVAAPKQAVVYDPQPFAHYTDLEKLLSGPDRRYLIGLYQKNGTKRGTDQQGLALEGFRNLFPEARNAASGAFLARLFRTFVRLKPMYKVLDYDGVSATDPELLDWPNFVNGTLFLTGKVTGAIGSEGAWIRMFWDAWTDSAAASAAAGSDQEGQGAAGTGTTSGDGEFDSLLAMLNQTPGKAAAAAEAAKADASFLEGSKAVWTTDDFSSLVVGSALLAKLDLIADLMRLEAKEGEATPDVDASKVAMDNTVWPTSLTEALFPNKSATVTLKDFYARFISSNTAPNLFLVLRAYVYSRLFIVDSARPPYRLVQPPTEATSLFPPMPLPPSPLLTPDIMCLLSMWLPKEILAGPPAAEGQVDRVRWDLLYQGSEQGFSMNRFESYAFRYSAPTLLLLSARIVKPAGPTIPGISPGIPGTPLLFAFFHTDAWKMNVGNFAKIAQTLPRSIFAQLKPALDVQFTTAAAPSTKPGHDRHLLLSPSFGLGIGAPESGLKGFRLSIDPTFQNGCYQFDPVLGGKQSYRPPSSAAASTGFSYEFEVLEIAVYGLGGPAALAAQKRSWASEKSEAERRKEVQIRKAGGGIDRDLLIMAGVLDDNVEGMGIERYKTEKEKEQERIAKEQGHF